jgi:hypothetical protein
MTDLWVFEESSKAVMLLAGELKASGAYRSSSGPSVMWILINKVTKLYGRGNRTATLWFLIFVF